MVAAHGEAALRADTVGADTAGTIIMVEGVITVVVAITAGTAAAAESGLRLRRRRAATIAGAAAIGMAAVGNM